MIEAESPSFTLPARIQAAACSPGVLTFVTAGEPDPVPWARLHDDARRLAARLDAAGVGPGAHVGLLGPTTRALVTAIQATWLAGGTVVVLPLPMRLSSIEEFVEQTRARVASADISLLVIDADLAGFLEQRPGDPPVARLQDLVADAANVPVDRLDVAKVGSGDLAVLQFTSGSTSDPKGVMLPHEVILANLDGAAVAAELDPAADVLVSWLPLYHDMGLIGLLTLSMISGSSLVLASPQDFMSSPGRWMEWISDYGGTATAGPNFSYALAARALKRMGRLDLSRWRVALNGAEPVDPDTMAAFCDAAAPHGFDPNAVFPAFGMAEVAIAGTFPPPNRGIVVDVVDRRVLETDRYAAPVTPDAVNARALPLLGRPVPGLEVRVCEPATGDVMREREVGEVELRGTSVTPGYYRRPDATRAAFHDEWLRTGDLGYLVDGELVVCGRIKDMIIVGGRNVFPEDVERAVAEVEGVRAGNVIAFGVEGHKGRESLVVVAEAREPDQAARVRTDVAHRVRNAIGLPPKDVVLVAPGSLPKTSSGKLQRSLCRSRYLEERLSSV